MTIYNVSIRDLGDRTGVVCHATVEYASGTVDNISYFPDSKYLCCDTGSLSQNVKRLCKRAWRQEAKKLDIKVKIGVY